MKKHYVYVAQLNTENGVLCKVGVSKNPKARKSSYNFVSNRGYDYICGPTSQKRALEIEKIIYSTFPSGLRREYLISTPEEIILKLRDVERLGQVFEEDIEIEGFLLPNIKIDAHTKDQLQKAAKAESRSLSAHIRHVLKLSVDKK